MDLNLIANVGLFFLISIVFGRVANFFKAPRLIGYLAGGVLFGPYVLGLFSEQLVDQMHFFTEMALAIIAFSIGATLKIRDIQKKKKVILGIAIAQGLIAAVIVGAALFASLYFFYNFESTANILGVSLILGAVAAATAPATILSLVREFKARGDFTTVLLGVIALDDALSIILYSLALSVAQATISGSGFEWYSGLAQPFLETIGAVVLGLGFGFIMKKIIRYFPNQELLLGMTLGMVLFIAGVANMLNFSHLLAIMVFAFYIENFADTEFAQKAYKSIDEIEEPILGVFFLLAGAHLNLNLALSSISLVIVVTLFRAFGKYGGTWLAGTWTGADKKVRRNMGLALLPSAGVAIGLVMDAKGRLSGDIPELAGIMVSIVIGQTLLNELVSPFFVKYALRNSGEIKE